MTLEATQLTPEVRYLVAELKLAPETAQLAEETYQEGRERGLARGRSLRVLAAASVFAAFRIRGEPAKFATLIEASGERRRAITKAYERLVRELGLKIPNARPSLLVPAIARILGLTDATAGHAVLLAERAEQDVAGSGCDTHSVAAAAVYYAGLGIRDGFYNQGIDFRTQETVAGAAQVTGVTLRKRFAALEHVFGEVPPPEKGGEMGRIPA